MSTQPDLANLLHPASLRRLAQDWLREDTPHFDYGGFVVGERRQTAGLLLKSPGVLAGGPFAQAVFEEVGCSVEWLRREGSTVLPVCRVATVRGKARHLLLGERVALNCVARASGIASASRRVAELAAQAGWGGHIAGTRKTTPGFRLVEKYAMMVGGVASHRYDLSSLIMLKDNHVVAAGNIAKAVGDGRKVGGVFTKIEVEARSLDEAREAARAGADIVMLDNFTAQGVLAGASALKEEFPGVLIEASGGITEENVTQYLSPHVDIISLGSLTQNYSCLDFSLKIDREQGADNGLVDLGPSSETPAGRRDFAF
ncbi:nicotinate-nucleotide pyrophosphorylase [carboxylating]-like [Heterodontus francisci]|uniref:nicotinate-nucleotide pyrophosphorylase [carboxylating]-like n=1 Tax=Heterodontus francisci TaxID=7792 RepID=UPI00355C880B